MSNIIINKRKIDNKHRPYIVAELSANHDGSIKKALKSIYYAKKCGADAIKFQTYTPDTITLNSNKKSFRIMKGNWKGYNLYNLYLKAHTPFEWHEELFNYSKEIGITCFSTPFDETAVELLEKLNSPAYKISSFEIVDIPLITLIAKTKKPIILSTGMASYKDIDLAVKNIKKYHNKIILLYCVSGYPTPLEELNLFSMIDLKKRYNLQIGLSDHSKGLLAPIIATSLGASLIEKHFTIDKKDKGPDSFFSITKEELEALCIDTKKTWLAIGGKKDKKVKKIEKEHYKFRRSLYVTKDIKKGELFSKDNIKSVRPGDGIHPKFFDKIIGKKAKKNLYKFNPLTKKDF
tara:strand:- start:113 stop:1156 length:1044 start_codon:yes stop_codon:yes gene_type:complete